MRLRRRGWAFLGEGSREVQTEETIASFEVVVQYGVMNSVWR
jgi:hypothetical protein